MRVLMITYDSLNRHMLPNYGNDWVKAPNFERLGKRAVTFTNSYCGPMPCMPARRELHTGRYNFLHRPWGPMESYDDSMPETIIIIGRMAVQLITPAIQLGSVTADRKEIHGKLIYARPPYRNIWEVCGRRTGLTGSLSKKLKICRNLRPFAAGWNFLI